MTDFPPLAHVIGSGPSGALAALALADAGWQVLVRDPLSPRQLLQRQRAYAFTHSSRQLLRQLGLWEELRPLLQCFTRLQLRDGGIERSVGFTTDDLGRSATAEAGAAIGWIGQHRPLMQLLLGRLQRSPCLELRLGPSAAAVTSGERRPDLVVAADGADSPTRESLGIGRWLRPHRQACLTAQVQLRGPADQEAWELLRPEGPFGVLPLGEGRFQLVWSAPGERCRRLESLPDSAFLDALAGALPDRLQPDALWDEPRAFPVALMLARRLHRGNTILLGETAHRCHPVGGQGLNLCWRDVAVLHQLALRVRGGRLRPADLGPAYARRRWPDLLVTLVLTEAIVGLTSNRHPLLLPLRRLALLLLQRAAVLRRLLLGSMTLGACAVLKGGGHWRDGDHHGSSTLPRQRPLAGHGHGQLPAASARHQ